MYITTPLPPHTPPSPHNQHLADMPFAPLVGQYKIPIIFVSCCHLGVVLYVQTKPLCVVTEVTHLKIYKSTQVRPLEALTAESDAI